MTNEAIVNQSIDAYKQFINGSDTEFNECFVNDLSSNASVTLSALEAGYAAMKELAILKGKREHRKASSTATTTLSIFSRIVALRSIKFKGEMINGFFKQLQ